MIVTTIATSLYLYFQVLCQVLASVDKGTKSCDMLFRKQILSAPWKNSCKITRSTFWSEFFTQHNLYNWKTFSSSELFYLIYRSASEKLITTCCSVSPRFLSCFALLQFWHSCASFFFAKTIWQSRETVATVEIFVSNKG